MAFGQHRITVAMGAIKPRFKGQAAADRARANRRQWASRRQMGPVAESVKARAPGGMAMPSTANGAYGGIATGIGGHLFRLGAQQGCKPSKDLSTLCLIGFLPRSYSVAACQS